MCHRWVWTRKGDLDLDMSLSVRYVVIPVHCLLNYTTYLMQWHFYMCPQEGERETHSHHVNRHNWCLIIWGKNFFSGMIYNFVQHIAFEYKFCLCVCVCVCVGGHFNVDALLKWHNYVLESHLSNKNWFSTPLWQQRGCFLNQICYVCLPFPVLSITIYDKHWNTVNLL